MKKLEINKEDLSYNLKLVKNELSDKTKIIAVVKANGMGLDLIQYTKFLIDEGIDFFVVANTQEALEIRKNKIDKNVLMMSEVIDDDELTELIKDDIILTIGNLEEKHKIEDIAQKLDKKVKAHVKIDTGFSRYRIFI